MLEPMVGHRRSMIRMLTLIIRNDQQNGQNRAHDDIEYDEDERLGVRVDEVRALPEDQEHDVSDDHRDGGDGEEEVETGDMVVLTAGGCETVKLDENGMERRE
jgi:hypothetical protein